MQNEKAALLQSKCFMVAQYQKVIACANKYQLEIAPVEAEQQEISSFRVTVPVIGSFNTGKSALLNGVLGCPLLPSSVVAETVAPTELTYGENTLLVHRPEGIQALGVGDMRTSCFEKEGILQMELRFKSPILQEFSQLCLVDMPGLDSGQANHENTLRAYLPRSLGYILVFSAEEPVLKESVCNFLAELQLRDIPVYILLTKCDKVTKTEQKQAILFFKRALKERLGLENIKIGCVQARPFAQIDDLIVDLRALQEMSEALCCRVYSGKLQQHIQAILAVLRLRLAGQSASTQELSQQVEALQGRIGEWEQIIARWQADMLHVTKQLQKNFMVEVTNRLEQMVPVFEAELSVKQDISDKLNSILYYMLLALVKKELTDAFRQYLTGLQSEVTFHAAQDGNEDVFDLLTRFEMWNQEAPTVQVEHSTTLVQACLGWMDAGGMKTILSEVRMTVHTKKKNATCEQLVKQVLIPDMLAEIERGVGEGLATYAVFMTKELRSAVAGRWKAMEQTLQLLLVEHAEQDFVQKNDMQQISQDIAMLEQMLSE